MNKLPKKEFLAQQPKKRSSAATLFINEEGNILILKTNYNKGWSIPGGMSDSYESPRENAIRETKEEIDLDTKITKLLCVDHCIKKDLEDEQLIFIFLGEKLREEQIKNIKLQESEIIEYAFVNKEEAIDKLKESISKRVRASLEALEEGTVAFLENGERIL